MQIPASFVRFLMSGVTNTLVTYGLYLALLQFLSYQLSYSISFVSGIALAYALNRYFVFKNNNGGKRTLFFPLVYVTQYLIGIFVVYLWAGFLGWPASAAPLASIAITIPLTYLLSRWIFNEKTHT